MDPRAYLIQRFEADHAALVQRASQLHAANAKRSPQSAGPDAITSKQMAEACDAVVRLLSDLDRHTSAATQIAELLSLAPRFEQLGAQQHLAAPVRSVYIGAATRIREIGAAESAAALKSTGGTQSDDDSALDDALDADDESESDDHDDIDDDDFSDDFDDTNGAGGTI